MKTVDRKFTPQELMYYAVSNGQIKLSDYVNFLNSKQTAEDVVGVWEQLTNYKYS